MDGPEPALEGKSRSGVIKSGHPWTSLASHDKQNRKPLQSTLQELHFTRHATFAAIPLLNTELSVRRIAVHRCPN